MNKAVRRIPALDLESNHGYKIEIDIGRVPLIKGLSEIIYLGKATTSSHAFLELVYLQANETVLKSTYPTK